MPTYNPDNESGGQMTAVVNGVDWNVKSYDFDVDKTSVDVTTTGDWDPVTKITYQRKKVTMAAGNFSLELFRDYNNDILPTIPMADDVANVVLNATPGHAFTMPKALIDKIKFKSGGTAGVAELSISGSGQGKFTIT